MKEYNKRYYKQRNIIIKELINYMKISKIYNKKSLILNQIKKTQKKKMINCKFKIKKYNKN